MKVALAMVTSLDGKSTKGKTSGTSPWASPKDQKIFRALIEAHDCVVMGSTTYKAVRDTLKPNALRPRIILTRNPEQFKDDVLRPGHIFTSEHPSQLVTRLALEGYEKVLLVGGAQTNSRFFDAGLVDELFITIEPFLFGTDKHGLPLVNSLGGTVALQLISHKQLNDQGTLLLHYSVSNNNQGN